MVSPINLYSNMVEREVKMKTYLFWKRFLIGCFFLVLLSGCATVAPEASASEQTATSIPSTDIQPPASCEEVEGICLSLTFDGENCTYEGSTEFAAGPVTLFFNNKSEGNAAVNFLMLLDGKTIEDVIEYHGEEPTTKHHPTWSQELGTWQRITPGGIQHWEGELEPADYFMVCASFTLGVWLGTGLTVR